MNDPRQRFTDRVDDYVRFRPGYPEALLVELIARCATPAPFAVADVGAGSGIFTRALLARGLEVYGVEPNAAMRRAAERSLARYAAFHSVDGSAENSGLADASVALVTAAQAFHWFDHAAARREFKRILEPGGQLALIWNRRRLEQEFQRDYDALLRRHAPEYGRANHLELGAQELARLFAPGRMQVLRFANRQRLDFDGLLGRLQSASYCPAAGSANHRALVTELERLFTRHARADAIDFEYDCELYLGRLDP